MVYSHHFTQSSKATEKQKKSGLSLSCSSEKRCAYPMLAKECSFALLSLSHPSTHWCMSKQIKASLFDNRTSEHFLWTSCFQMVKTKHARINQRPDCFHASNLSTATSKLERHSPRRLLSSDWLRSTWTRNNANPHWLQQKKHLLEADHSFIYLPKKKPNVVLQSARWP